MPDRHLPGALDSLTAYAREVGLSMAGVILGSLVSLGLTVAGLAGTNVVLPAWGWALLSWVMLLVGPYLAYRRLLARVRALEADRDVERLACEHVRGMTVLADGRPIQVGELLALDEARFGTGTCHDTVRRIIARHVGIPPEGIDEASLEALFNQLAVAGVLGDGRFWAHQYGAGTKYAWNDLGRRVAAKLSQEKGVEAYQTHPETP